MTDRNKDLLFQAALLAVLVLFFSKILFTGKIVRAPDIINEFYWGVKDLGSKSLWDLLHIHLSATWDPLVNSGHTNNGGMASLQFLFYQNLIFHFFPAPASVAWFMVLHLFFGAAGTYCCCRLIGCSRPASLLGGLVFALSPENATLINAGHVMKIATISFAPWAFYFFERGFKSRRLIFFLTTALVLAFQFFNTHWQVAFYTCLCIGAYGLLRSIGILIASRAGWKKELPRLLGLNLVVLIFFLSTVAISLLPLASWSSDTNRGVQSGANQGKGGLDREEAMMWSMPPEELTGFIIPGFFGLSRQEAGENPPNIRSYYWGRMVFTQTDTYMGLLPWLLVPLALVFRRDRYAWLAVAGIVGGILFSMGKYTPVYNFLFDHFPGINRFRVPKMMMFIPVFGLALLASRGLDCLFDGEVAKTRGFKRYLAGLVMVPAALLLLLGIEVTGKHYWIRHFIEWLSRPTRFEQGAYLVMQRWDNLVTETALAACLAALCASAVVALRRRWLSPRTVLALLFAFYLLDVWRIDDKFLFLVKEPAKLQAAKSPVMEFLAKEAKGYRVLPMDGSDPMQYVANGVAVMFASNAVQQRRWQDFLDTFSLASAMPDLMDVKYLVMGKDQYQQEKGAFGSHYSPVFEPTAGGPVVLENRQVLPRAWLAPAAYVMTSTEQTLTAMRSPVFDPRRMALVESRPPIPMPGPGAQSPPGEVTVTRYGGERIDLTAHAVTNALLVLSEKYYRGWRAVVDGRPAEIQPVDHVLRGIYVEAGDHTVQFIFDPRSFKIGKYLTLASFALFAAMIGREMYLHRKGARGDG